MSLKIQGLDNVFSGAWGFLEDNYIKGIYSRFWVKQAEFFQTD